MKIAVLIAAFAHVATCGFVRMPYLNPAGVTYVDGAYHAGLAAGPLFRSAPIAHAPVVAHAPVAYAAQQYAAVPTVHHVPSEAHIPVTRYEAQPAVIQKVVDVAKPAVKTRRFEIRRPAIQKQFYDIEERIVVRPAGSALVELEEPTSKTQKGAALIHPAVHAVPAVHAAVPVAHAALPVAHAAVPVAHAALPVAHTAVPVAPALARFQYATPYSAYTLAHAAPFPSVSFPQYGTPVQNISQPLGPAPLPPQEQEPQQQPQQPQQPEEPQFDNSDADSVSIDNPEFGARSAQPQPQPQPQPQQQQQFQPQPQQQEQASPAPESEQPQARLQPESRSLPSSPLVVNYPSNLELIPQARAGPALVPSLRNLPEVSQANQQRLIQLLTARGGVAEVGFGRSGPAVNPVGEAGQVRARVLSATPAPPEAEPAGERVNTRRVVVSRPIETLQEIEVAEPVTKLERIHVNHPTFIKTARQDLVRVPTSVPVYGKALAPVAHAAPVAYGAAYGGAYAPHVSYYG